MKRSINKKGLSTRQIRQAGITLTEAILGIATLGAGLGVIAKIQTDNLDNIRQEAAAQQMKILMGAAKGFVRDYYGPLTNGCGVAPQPACPTATRVLGADTLDLTGLTFPVAVGATEEIPASALYATGYIDGAQIRNNGVNWVFNENSFGSEVFLTVTNTGAPAAAALTSNRLRLQLVTRGGVPLSDKAAASVASRIGPEGGFRPADETVAAQQNLGSSLYDSANVQGAFGNWQVTAADMGGAGVAPDTGGLAAVAYFGEGGVVADFLYRNTVPGQPEAQRMNANIDAGGFGLANVSQIGATAAGNAANPAANPDVTNTNIAPGAIVATFGAGTAANPELNAAAPNADNTVRFGDATASGFAAVDLGGVDPARYDRGNVNIQANDLLARNIDAAASVRSLRMVEAADRETDQANRIQRFGIYSGFDETGAVAADPAIRGTDNNSVARSETTFSREATGGATVGTGVDRMRDGAGQDRFVNQYDAGTGGNLTLTDNLNRQRLRAEYTNPTTSSLSLNDGVGAAPGTQRFTTAYAATAGNLTLTDNAALPRARTDYTTPTQGSQSMRDAVTDRYRNQYNAATGDATMFDNAGVARDRSEYTATGGQRIVRDNTNNTRSREIYDATSGEYTQASGANVRTRSSYNGATGQLMQIDETSKQRMDSQYLTPNTGSVTLRDGTGAGIGVDRSISFYDATQSGLALNDPSGARKVDVVSGTTAQGGAIGLNQPNTVQKVIAFAGDNANGSGIRFRDNANTDRVSVDTGNNAAGSTTSFEMRDSASTTIAGFNARTGDTILNLGNGNTDPTYFHRINTAGDQTDLYAVIGDNGGTGAINSNGATADSFNIHTLGIGNRLKVKSDGAVGINIDAPAARLDVNCNGGDPNCVLWRNNGNTTMNHLASANGTGGYTRLGTAAGPVSSPTDGNFSVLDVDDIFLRSRGLWLSNAVRYRITNIAYLQDGGVINSGVPAADCPTSFLVITPNSWASPIGRTDVDGLGIEITSAPNWNDTRVRTFGSHLGGNSFQVNIQVRGVGSSGGGNYNDTGWISATGGYVTAQVVCYS
jgi:hypothetical protein